MDFLLFLVATIGILVVAIWLFIVRQGDAEMEFLVDQRTDFTLVEVTKQAAVFSCEVPFLNKGTQDGTIMDAYTRHLLPQEQYDAVEVYSRLELEGARRTDGYWESIIIPKTTGETVIVTVKLTAKDGNLDQAIADMVDMSIDIVYQVVARSDWYITKSKRIVMEADEILKAYQKK